MKWLKAHEKVTGKVGTIGWCFGGGLSLDASIATPVDATVVYYGRVDADDLKALDADRGYLAFGGRADVEEIVDAFAGQVYEEV